MSNLDTDVFKVALFGAGRIGQIHAHNIASHPHSKLSAVVDINQDAASVLADKYDAQVATAEQVFSDENVDAVLIASATDSHADLIERAAQANKKIFCEKPIDLSLDRVNRCLEIVDQHQATLFIGFNRRFDKNFAALKHELNNGMIGKPELVLINSRDPGLPPLSYLEASGGLFRDMSIHDFDMACWLMGQTPVSVLAVGACLVNPEVEAVGDIDTGVITLKFATGAIAVIMNSRRTTYGYDQRIEVHGCNGMLQAENEVESTLVKTNEQGVIRQKPLHFFLERYSSAYKAEWHHFVGVLTGQQSPEVSGKDGQTALMIANAAIASLKTGQNQILND